ncbi:YaiI/YqxD family protein [Rhodoligotrophos ferricapiens]|uniref:YaiI/YqxD family protein n=1 Tax=Rhodoligotrophos ferricapiens TaxID=3069264 RepID=UPI00315DB1FE
MLEIFVDADACPVKAEVERVATRHGLKIHLVSNSGMRPTGNPLVHNVVVSDGADAADDWIAQHVGPGDLVITADIPLASRSLDKGARVIGPKGKTFTAQNIGMALATRALLQHHREAEGTQTFNAGFGPRDRSNFLNVLENEIQAIKRSR